MSTEIILEADNTSGYLAKLRVRYSWNVTGNEFTCTALQYWATDNGRGSGNAYLRIEIDGKNNDSGDFLNDNGAQDGQWHDIQNKSWTIKNVVGISAQLIFTWTYDIAVSRDKYLGPNNPPTVTFIPRSPIINPIKNFTASPVLVTGTNGIPGFTLLVHRSFDYVKATARIAADGTWAADLQLPAGRNRLSINADQSKGSAVSAPSNSFDLYRAALTSPAAGEVVTAKDLVYQAIGAPGSAMYALGMQWNDQYSERTLVNDSGNWQAPSTHVFPSGDAEVRVRFYDDPAATASYGYTQSVVFKVLGYPLITLPIAASLQNSNFDLSGNNGLAQSTIFAYYDLTDTVVGQGTVRQDGTWTIPVAVRAGSVSLAVEQSSGGKSSGRGTYRPFKIRPPQPVRLTVQVDAQSNVILGSNGHIGATFDLHVVNNGTPFRSFTVTTSPWTELFPDWLPGTSQIVGRQSVPDGAGQPIYSDWTASSAVFTVDVPLPTLTHRVSPDGIPTFLGMGKNWPGQPASTIEVRLNHTNDPIVPIVDVRSDRSWTSAAAAPWAPGTYSVTARQSFKTLSSTWLQPTETVVISAPPAVIEKVTPNGLFVKAAGRCWPGAELIIKFSDNPASHTVADTDKDGQWDFQRPTAFRPGSHTVTVTQTFGGQTSNSVSMSFDIVLSAPVITPPDTGQTDHLPMLYGTGGIAGCTIRVYDFVTRELLGETIASGNEWSVQISELDYQTYTVFAVQLLDDLQSQHSASVVFTVVLLAPTIDFPKNRTSVPRTFTVEGYARAGKGFDRTEVEIYLDDVPHRVYPFFGDGYFKQHFTRPLGPCVLKARQYFKDQESPNTQEVLVTIVPDKALIETPAMGEAVGRTATICGFGYPKDKVVVALPGGTELGQAEVQEDGTWFCRIELTGTGTDLSLLTEQRKGEFHSGWSEPRTVQLLEAPPTFSEPSEGKWEATRAGFAGGALAGSKVDVLPWHNAEEKHANALVTNGGRWAGASERNLPAGPHWARAVQILGGKRSVPADSKRFEVAPSDEPTRPD